MKQLFTILFLFFGAIWFTNVNSQTNEWIGAFNNNWNYAGNWSLGIVPTASHDVLLKVWVPSALHNPKIYGIAVCNNLTIQNLNHPPAKHLDITSTGNLTVTNDMFIKWDGQCLVCGNLTVGYDLNISTGGFLSVYCPSANISIGNELNLDINISNFKNIDITAGQINVEKDCYIGPKNGIEIRNGGKLHVGGGLPVGPPWMVCTIKNKGVLKIWPGGILILGAWGNGVNNHLGFLTNYPTGVISSPLGSIIRHYDNQQVLGPFNVIGINNAGPANWPWLDFFNWCGGIAIPPPPPPPSSVSIDNLITGNTDKSMSDKPIFIIGGSMNFDEPGNYDIDNINLRVTGDLIFSDGNVNFAGDIENNNGKIIIDNGLINIAGTLYNNGQLIAYTDLNNIGNIINTGAISVTNNFILDSYTLDNSSCLFIYNNATGFGAINNSGAIHVHGSDNLSNVIGESVHEITMSNTDVTGAGLQDGTATIDITNSFPPTYTFLWNDPMAQTTQTAVNLDIGVFKVEFTHQNGCKDLSKEVILDITMDNWVGGIDDDWFNPANWADNSVPITEDVAIPPDMTYMPVISSGGATCGSLNVFEGASLIISSSGSLTTNGLLTNNGSLLIDSDNSGSSGSLIDNDGLGGTGTFQFNRYLSSGAPGTHFGWHYISSPVNNSVTGDLIGYWVKEYIEPSYDPGTGESFYFFDIDPCDPGCCPASQFTVPISVMKGYSVKQNLDYSCLCPAGDVISFGGDLQSVCGEEWLPPCPGNHGSQPAYMSNVNTGNRDVNITASNNGPFPNFNLIGNPYPSGWDYDAFFFGPNWPLGLNDAIYYWDEDMDQYSSYVNGVGTNGGSNFVPPTQAFFLEADGTIPNITLSFTNAERTHTGAGYYYKNGILNVLKLKVSGNDFADETVIRFHEDATYDWDGHYDAKKLLSLGESVPALYTKASDTKLSINSMPVTENVSVYLNCAQSGNFIIEAIESDFEDVLLIDNKTGAVHELSTSYKFYYEAGEDENRFNIHFGNISTEAKDNSFVIYSNQNNIIVYNIKDQQGDVYIYNLVGQLLQSTSLQDGINNITLNKANGYYIVNVRTSESTVNKKVYIK